MKKIFLALLLLWPSLAWAQCNGVFPPNTLCGNLTGSPAVPSAFSASGTVSGPGSSTVGDVAIWNNTGGTLLADKPPLQIYGTIANNLFMAGPSTGGPLNPTFRAITQADIQSALNAISNPTHQTFLSGSGTYTTPANTRWIEITIIGAGGGGGGGKGSSTGGGTGGTGGNTCWNTSGAACTSPVYQAGGGIGGFGGGAAGIGTAGGTVSGSGTCDWGVGGGAGQATFLNTAFVNSVNGGAGGNSTLGGGGTGPVFLVGIPPAANSGSGGSGGSGDSTTADTGGDGGGAGATCHVIISAPAGTYTYAVGAAGTAGTAGTGGTNPRAGTAGAVGQIIVYEHYAP